MKNPALLKELTKSRTRLESIAKSQGIALNIVQVPLMTPELRDFCDALAICPDDAAAERSTKRFSPAVAGFLLLSRDIAGAFSSGQYTNYEVVDSGLCPYFYIARYVGSRLESIDDFIREKREAGEL